MTLQKADADPQRPCVIIYLGAGICGDLDEHLASNPQRLVLVEPDPEKVSLLRERAEGRTNISVVPAAISETSGKALFRVYNMPSFSSLREATGLRELYPGLRERDNYHVRTISISEFIASQQLDPNQLNYLIIDTPGEESIVLDVLHRNNQIDLFQSIVLYAGLISLYQGGSPAGELLHGLAQSGFVITEEDKLNDPDRPRWTLRRDDRWRELLTLRSRNETLEVEKINLMELVREHEIIVKKLEDERQTLVAGLARSKKDYEILQAEHRMLADLANERMNDIDAARNQCLELSAHEKECKGRLEQVIKERDDLGRQVARQKSQIKELESSIATMEWRQALMSEEIIKAEGQLELVKDIVLRGPDL